MIWCLSYYTHAMGKGRPASSKSQWVPKRSKVPKIDPNFPIFAFYCIFTLQFSKASGCPCTHATHGYGDPAETEVRPNSIRFILDKKGLKTSP